jgi:prepilin-type processing-associated H-X9-DG protein/prepilin-type N-terminal cleavage/methylation domain-containing protein
VRYRNYQNNIPTIPSVKITYSIKVIRKRKCFTLIELLVVVAIIAVLIAILLPALSKARDNARSVSCLSNAKQLATAINMYMNETDRLPLNSSGSGFKFTWYEDVSVYYGKYYAITKCPSVPPDAWCWGDGFSLPGGSSPYPTNYGFNFYYLDGVSSSQINNPTETVLLAETSVDSAVTYEIGDIVSYPPSQIAGQPLMYVRRPAPRHSGRCSVGFVDGHASSCKMGTLFYPKLPWFGNGILNPKHPNYKDQLWDRD